VVELVEAEDLDLVEEAFLAARVPEERAEARVAAVA
jgi:hypothetical protein